MGTILLIKSAKEKIKDHKGLSPKAIKYIEQGRANLVDKKGKAIEDFPEWDQITDEAIKEIIGDGTYRSIKHSDSSDAARRAILRLYTSETFLYSALNRASQCKDQRAIKTLGPYAYLLYRTLNHPP